MPSSACKKKSFVDQRSDQVAGDVVDQGFRSPEQVMWIEGLVANSGGDVEPGKGVRPSDQPVAPLSLQLALGLADVWPVRQQLRRHSDAQRVNDQVIESRRNALDGLRIAIEDLFDAFLDLQDLHSFPTRRSSD